MSEDLRSVESINTIAELKNLLSTYENYGCIQRYLTMLDYNNHQPQGRDPCAGMKHSSSPTPTGRNMSRLPRAQIKNKGFGGQRVVQVPHARGGRRAHPLRVEKNIKISLNRKEKKSAILNIIAHAVSGRLEQVEYNFSKTSEFSTYLSSLISSEIKSRTVKKKFIHLKKYTKDVLLLYSDIQSVRSAMNIPNVALCNVAAGNRMYNAINPGKSWDLVLIDQVTSQLLLERVKSLIPK